MMNLYSKEYIAPFQTKYFPVVVVLMIMRMRGLMEVAGVLRGLAHFFHLIFKKNIT